ILDHSQLFIGSTPLPLPLANAALQSIKLLRTDKGLKQRLLRNTDDVKSSLREAGLLGAETPGPIIPIYPGSPAAASRLSRQFLAARIYPPFIKYPGGPPAGHFRFVISSEHTSGQLNDLLRVLREGLLKNQ